MPRKKLPIAESKEIMTGPSVVIISNVVPNEIGMSTNNLKRFQYPLNIP